jgi:hypothetical protein
VLRNRRRAATAITAITAAASTIALAIPAQAAILPEWPTAGHVPTGATCGITSLTAGTLYTNTYADSGTPVVSDVSISGGTSVVVPPAGTAYRLTVKVSEPCSGTGYAEAVWLHNGRYDTPQLQPDTTNAFSGPWSVRLHATPADVGLYRVSEFLGTRRYDSFTLDPFFAMVGSPVLHPTPVPGTWDYSVGAWSVKNMYLLAATTLTSAVSATTVARGKAVRAGAVLRYAKGSTYVLDKGEKVLVQTRVGTGRWVTRARLVTNAAGAVAYSFVVNATTSVRFVHPTTHAGKFTSTATSPARTVKVG